MDYLSVKEAALLLGKTETGVLEMIWAKRLPALDGGKGLGKGYRIALSDLEPFIAALSLCPKGLHPRSDMRIIARARRCPACGADRERARWKEKKSGKQSS